MVLNKDKKTYIIILTLLFITSMLLSLSFFNFFSNNEVEFSKEKKTEINIVKNEPERFNIQKLNDSRKVRVYNITANEGYYEYISGKKTFVYSYNNLMPGPIIRGRVGDKIIVNFFNNLYENSTIHWHGLEINNSADGVPFVTQDPVPPKGNFTYIFKLKNPGVYWYHSHVNSRKQVDLGLQGVLIVDYDDEPFYYDYDKILVLDDVKINSEGEHYPFYDDGMEIMHGRFGNVFLINGNASSKIKVYNNSILRLRLINTANARTFNFKVEGHQIIVLGKDIGLTKPYSADFLTITPGERFDILLILKNESKKNINLYNVNSRGYVKIGSLEVKPSNKTLLKYQNIEDFSFEHKDDHKDDHNNTNFKGSTEFLSQYNFSKYLDEKENLTVYLKGIRTSEGLRWTINGKTHPENTEVFNVKKGYFYKIKLVNTQRQPHPMHLHGQKFKILKRNGVPTNDDSFKDTVLVNGLETVEIGLIPEEVGNWVFHCHILEHVDKGMLSVVRVY